jgi:serine/threonine-protein kinase
MTTSSPPPPDDSPHDLRLAEILDRALAGSAASRPTLEQLAARHPEFADELRQLWGAVMVVDAVAAGSTAENAVALADRGTDSPTTPPSRLGDYELLEEIGRGGMGVVYRARQTRLDREVALKVLLRNAGSSVDEARFRAEAEAAARLDHPRIVAIYEAGEAEGWRYLAMKLIRGCTLARRLAESPVPHREAARIVMEAAFAIEYAHRQGVVHRDLKPANILLDDAGAAYVSDFGLAKQDSHGESLTTTGAILGTPLYMSPEQAAPGRRKVGPASDVFSLGAILYAALTGRPPFQASTPVRTLMTLLEQDPAPPRDLDPRIPQDLEMIVLRALQKPPELRYESAGALAEDLGAYLAGEPVAARSGRLSHVVARLFGETHHAAVLENWGLLWMWHAVVLMLLCLTTNLFHLRRGEWPVMNEHWPYALLWGGGIAVWAPIFWAVRRRSGPVTAVERQIAHAWGGSIAAVVLLFVVESALGLDVLTLSPVLGLISGLVFVVKAGILSGAFYFSAAALMASSVAMAWMQRLGCPYGVTLFGLVAAATFFVPGLKYYRESRQKDR